MRPSLLIIAGISVGLAADPARLALVTKAQADWERVELVLSPDLTSASNCVQSQAAILAASAPEDLAQTEFRKAYCTLAAAAVTNSRADYLDAAAGFDRAREAWPARVRKTPKHTPPEPAPSALAVLGWIARLHAGVVEAAAPAAEIAEASCVSMVMSRALCGQSLAVARVWVGWSALGENRLEDAARNLAAAADTGWTDWVEGRRLFQQRRYRDAAVQYRAAIETWNGLWKSAGGPRLAIRLGPPPQLPVALSDLGAAQLLAGDARGALASLNLALQADPRSPTALFRRARAHEVLGQGDLAIADYNLASRAAFAQAQDLASGEAHLYRGIVHYRRKDFARAEDEFASALNFEIPEVLRADAQAWRHMAALAGGSCGGGREFLEKALPGVSPYFPKDEARSLAASCGGLR